MLDSSQGLVAPLLPPAFALRFDRDRLASQGTALVIIDPVGTILWLNAAWYRFAKHNDGADVLRRFDVGCCYFDGMTEPTRRDLSAALTDALSKRTPFEQEYDCSSPAFRRVMRLRALPVEGAGFLLEHSEVAQEPATIGLGEPPKIYTNPEGFVLQCSNCRKVRRVDSNTWDWVPRFVTATSPAVSHGVCDVCLGFYWGTRMRRR